MKNIIDYLNKLNRRSIAPIGNCEKDFEFLCLGDVSFAKAMGFKTFYVRESLEKVIEGNMTTQKQFDNIKKNMQFDYSYFEREIENLIHMKSEKDVPVGGGCFGPLTIASSIIGVALCNRLAIKQPEFLEQVVSYITDYIIELALLEEKSGADFFWIAEPLASLFSPDKFWRFSGVFLNKIYKSISVAGFLHVCGKTLKHTEEMVKTGAEVLSIDYVTDIEECIKIVPKNIVIMGNMNPMLLLNGTKDEVRKEVIDLNFKMKSYSNFIFSSGCLIPWKTPEENIQLMIEITREFKMDVEGK